MLNGTKPYHELAAKLKNDLHALENLYHERSALQAEKERFAQDRREIVDDLLDARNESATIARLAMDLESKDRDLPRLEAILSALTSRIQAQEASFHELIPKACHTFTRLLITFRSMVHGRQVEMLRSLIHEGFRDQFQSEIELLADATCEAIEISQIQIPSGGVWSLTRQLTEKDREETLKFVRTTAVALTDQADELLVEIGKLGDPEVPEFVLGALPEPPSEAPAPPAIDFESEWQNPQERDFIMQLCQEAGEGLLQTL